MTHATPAKLRDGSWGARVQGTVKQGDVITITTRAGKTWDATVSRVVWSNDDVAICATGKVGGSSHSAPRHTSRSGCARCCETPARRSQIWQECGFCGTEPVYI